MPSGDEWHGEGDKATRAGRWWVLSQPQGSALIPHPLPWGRQEGMLCPGHFQLLHSSLAQAARGQGCLCGMAPSTSQFGCSGAPYPDATLGLPFGGLLRCPGCASCCTESLPAWLLIQIRADVNTGVMFSGMISDCLLLPVPMVINAVPLHAIVLLNTYTRGCFHRG